MFVRFIRRLARDQGGGTAIEYGLIAALMVLAMIVAFAELADTTNGLWSGVKNKVVKANTNG
ncbi:Flp family type IVb pilin [Sphingomonas sp. PB4P5]|jgi:pilus assembly protein Flp/PilA|uniref:Flp family type IVb pilin n=1 Tax=Parasphingomonas puruogangriensis TaxID=3096155 RepID=UPI002FC9B4B7